MIAAKVANALALDYPRERLRADRRLRRLHRRHRRAGPRRRAPTSSSSCRAAARSPPRTPRAERGRRRAPRLLRRQQRSGSRTRCAAWSRPSPTREVGYVCGQVRFTGAGGDNLEGAYWRYEMAVRELESGLGGSPPATAASTRSAATPTSRCDPPAATTSPSRSSSPSAACARSTRPARGPRRRWCRRWRASSPANGG